VPKIARCASTDTPSASELCVCHARKLRARPPDPGESAARKKLRSQTKEDACRKSETGAKGANGIECVQGNSLSIIIEKLEALHSVHKPWRSVEVLRNLVSKKPYSGINGWLLTAQDHTSPYWATIRQIDGPHPDERRVQNSGRNRC
jgi:hypothetical protein